MRQSEHGLSTIELTVTILIMAVIALGASMTIFQTIKVTAQSDNSMTAVQQVQNAGFWVSRDARMASGVNTDNLTEMEFLVLSWSEGDTSENTTSHVVTYFFEDLSDNIGKLKRNHASSEGLNKDTLVAQYIRWDPADPAYSSNVSYSNPSLTVKLTATYGGASETREYRVSCRPRL